MATWGRPGALHRLFKYGVFLALILLALTNNQRLLLFQEQADPVDPDVFLILWVETK